MDLNPPPPSRVPPDVLSKSLDCFLGAAGDATALAREAEQVKRLSDYRLGSPSFAVVRTITPSFCAGANSIRVRWPESYLRDPLASVATRRIENPSPQTLANWGEPMHAVHLS